MKIYDKELKQWLQQRFGVDVAQADRVRRLALRLYAQLADDASPAAEAVRELQLEVGTTARASVKATNVVVELAGEPDRLGDDAARLGQLPAVQQVVAQGGEQVVPGADGVGGQGVEQGQRLPAVRRGLPVRGQRTKTNARTRKGPKRTVAGKKKAK